jgi:alpha-tubulin suppressor-like RCC1 family protein
VPVYVKGLIGVKSFAGGGPSAAGEDMCVLLLTGKLACWGTNAAGSLGNGGDETDSNVPVSVAHLANVKSAFMLANGGSNCAIVSTGRIYCWGYNANGQLGDGTNKSSSVPVAVSGITDATSLSGGLYSTCALLATGRVDCWGANDYGSLTGGELGNGGDEANSYVPVKVSGIGNATGIFGGGTPYCAVLTTGGVDCWGSEIYEASDGAYVGSDVPVPIKGVTDAKSVIMSGGECALLTTGGVDCWGYWGGADLGNGDEPVSPFTAVAVKGLDNAIGLAPGNGPVCALRATGHVSCWGDGGDGELGNGTTNGSASVPVPVSVITDAVSITGGADGFCALLKTGGVD